MGQAKADRESFSGKFTLILEKHDRTAISLTLNPIRLATCFTWGDLIKSHFR